MIIMMRYLVCGLVIMAIGSVWIFVILSDSYTVMHNMVLEPHQSNSFEMIPGQASLVYYTVGLADIGDAAFVQIIDPNGNIIEDRAVKTRLAVNYAEVSGITYTVRVTNMGDTITQISISIGVLPVETLAYPSVMVVGGFLLTILSAFATLNRYRTAQPDEKI